MSFLKWYKKTIESGAVEPPSNTWENIQNDLDIDLVYDRLEKSLAAERRKVWIWRASSAASILLLLSVGYMLINRVRQTSTEQPIAQNTTSNSHLSIDTISIQTNSQILQTDSTTNPTQITKEIPELIPITEESSLIVQTNAKSIEKKSSLESDSFKIHTVGLEIQLVDNSNRYLNSRLASMEFSMPDFQLITVPESPLAHPEYPKIKQEPPHPIINNRRIYFSKITISAHGEIANTWLISPKTVEAFDPQELTATRPTFKQNYGISVAGTLTERWEVIGQFSMDRQNGQHYKEYYQGKYVSNNIDLEYTDLALKARYRPFRKTLNHAFSAGIYTGFLNNARQFIGSETFNISSDYANTDFGLTAGYEYFAPLTDKITLAAGVFYRQGLKNVFTGNKQISSNLNHSTNTSFNFTLSVGYTISL
ncbi:PorT family protein [Marinilabilia sp.]|uniref:PorT family protein n=1 Tax=Marinilabilia sp. TaxID=2021252 RepID=UPI0025BAA7AE|nr:PorT family protein [Marinilabilia sp.]